MDQHTGALLQVSSAKGRLAPRCGFAYVPCDRNFPATCEFRGLVQAKTEVSKTPLPSPHNRESRSMAITGTCSTTMLSDGFRSGSIVVYLLGMSRCSAGRMQGPRKEDRRVSSTQGKALQYATTVRVLSSRNHHYFQDLCPSIELQLQGDRKSVV